MTAILVIISVLVLFGLILVSSVQLRCRYERRGDDDQLTLQVTWLRYLTYTLDIPLVDLKARLQKDTVIRAEVAGEQTEVPLSLEMFETGLERLIRFHATLKYVTAQTRIKKLEWVSEFGLSSASSTGMLTGLAWSVKGIVLSAISSYSRLETTPRISVRPNFQKPLFHTLVDCIFSIRIGHLMLGGLKTVLGSRL